MEGGPNQGKAFEKLCERVESSTQSVHTALQEFLLCKDELLKHSLPSSLLVRLSLVAGKLMRSFSMLESPLGELLHLVRLYSVPWDEKSEILKKLHDAAQIKQGQLNVALRKIELFAVQEQRMMREKHIMNWEKLFAKLTNKNSHGRRWKFLIESFKTRLNSGLPIDDSPRFMEGKSSYPMESAQQPRESDIHSMSVQRDETVTPMSNASFETDETKGTKKVHFASDTATSSVSSEDLTFPSATPPSAFSVTTVATAAATPTFPPPLPVETTDVSTWTHEKQYNRYLHVRVFEPTGLEEKEVYCTLALGPQLVTSRIFGIPEKEKEEGVSSRLLGSGSGTGSRSRLIATSQTRLGLQSSSRSKLKSISATKISHKTCDEFRFFVPYEEKVIIVKNSEEEEEKLASSSNLKKSHLTAILSTANMAENANKKMSTLNLSVHTNKGDKAMIGMASFPLEKLSIKDLTREDQENGIEIADSLEPVSYALVPLKGGLVGCAAHLVCYWTRQERVLVKTQSTATLPMEKIVQSLGYVRAMTPPEQSDVQVQAFEGEEEEEEEEQKMTPEGFVRQEELTELVMRHAEEMEILQGEYAKRVESLTSALNNLQIQARNLKQRNVSPVVSSATSLVKPEAKEATEKYMQMTRWKKDPSYPEDFFSRLEYFAKESLKRQQMLTRKIRDEVAGSFEKAMACLRRLDTGAQRQVQTAGNEEVCLPAVFMPTRPKTVFTPKAHSYFHPIGAGLRLTQPPSVFKLPSIPGHVSTLNLFELSKGFVSLVSGKEDVGQSKTPPPSHVNVLEN
ncbi:uncharacterized protein [Oscarella lobularis]|uniref:uncharacterized protein isoform X2 n=1 Tax=Oscarella lobularis TaxID=121494 RepID=UPI0033141592